MRRSKGGQRPASDPRRNDSGRTQITPFWTAADVHDLDLAARHQSARRAFSLTFSVGWC